MDATPRASNDILMTAAFDRNAIIRYHWTGLLVLSLLIVTIPLVIVAAAIYAVVLDRIVKAWSAELTPQSLIVRKGVWNKVERTIPLEKITDLSVAQGPVMRLCGIDRIGVETAGQAGNQAGGPLISLLGVTDSKSFRAAVLAQRDRLSAPSSPSGHAAHAGHADRIPGDATHGTSDDRLAEISDTLRRIEMILERSNS